MVSLILANKNLPESFYIEQLSGSSKIVYLPKLDFTKLSTIVNEHIDNQDQVIIFGFPYKYTKEKYVISEITKLQHEKQVEFKHFCTFGDSMQSLNSQVSETESNIQMLFKWLFKVNTVNDTIVQCLQSYHEYSFKDSVLPLIVRELLDFYRTDFYNEFTKYGSNINRFIKNHSSLIKHLERQRTEYIDYKKQQARIVKLTDNVCLVTVYAERYKNELAHELLNSDKASSFRACIVIVGTHTKGSDMLSIRTKGINADHIARTIGDGRGKRNVASVFVNSTIQPMYDTLKTYLTEREYIDNFLLEDK